MAVTSSSVAILNFICLTCTIELSHLKKISIPVNLNCCTQQSGKYFQHESDKVTHPNYTFPGDSLNISGALHL